MPWIALSRGTSIVLEVAEGSMTVLYDIQILMVLQPFRLMVATLFPLRKVFATGMMKGRNEPNILHVILRYSFAGDNRHANNL